MTTDTPKTTRKRAAKKQPIDAIDTSINSADDVINTDADGSASDIMEQTPEDAVAAKPRRRSTKKSDEAIVVEASVDETESLRESSSDGDADNDYNDSDSEEYADDNDDEQGDNQGEDDRNEFDESDEDSLDQSQDDEDDSQEFDDEESEDDDDTEDADSNRNAEPVELVEGGVLYFVGVPIGNHDDITLRALNVLQGVDVVVCEEFKVGAALMRSYNLSKKLIAMNEHNESDVSDEVLQLAISGKRVAVISDAGMPIVADPGSTLFDKARASGVVMNVVPGVSSIIAALVASGFRSDEFDYIGFLSRKTEDRAVEAASLVDRTRTLVILESPYRLQSLLSALAEAMPHRMASIAMNLTMPSESVLRGTLAELHARFTEKKFRGEFVVVLDAYQPSGEVLVASARPMAQRRDSFDEGETRRPQHARKPGAHHDVDVDDQRKWLNAEGQPIRPPRGSGSKTGRFGKPSAPRGGSGFPRRDGPAPARGGFKRPDSRDGFRRDDRRSGTSGSSTRTPYAPDTRRKPFSGTDSSKVYTPPNARRPYGSDDRRKPYSQDDRRKPYSQSEPRRSGPPRDPNRAPGPRDPNRSSGPRDPNRSSGPRDPNRSYSPDSQRKPYSQGDSRRSHPQDNRRKSYPSNESRTPRTAEDRRRPYGQTDGAKSYSSDDRRNSPRSGDDRRSLGPDDQRRQFQPGPSSGTFKPKRPTGDRGPRTKK